MTASYDSELKLLASSLSERKETRSAYHLYSNLGETFLSNGTGIFLGIENRNGIELTTITINKIPVNFSLSLDMKPGTGNSKKWYRKFWSFR